MSSYRHYTEISVGENIEHVKTEILDEIEICGDRLENMARTMNSIGVPDERDADVFVQLLKKTSKSLALLFQKVQILY